MNITGLATFSERSFYSAVSYKNPMKADKNRGRCPLCGEPNPHSVDYCQRCQYRLPWSHPEEDTADSNTKPKGAPVAESSPILGEMLRDRAPLPRDTLVCRYCLQPIAEDTRRCPHCKEWLVLAQRPFGSIPWTPAYDDEDASRLSGGGARLGCFSLIALIVPLIAYWLRL